MTSKGSITGQLQRAIAAGDVLAVRSLAGELPEVPLATAAEITLLFLEREPESYAPAAFAATFASPHPSARRIGAAALEGITGLHRQEHCPLVLAIA